MNDVGDTMLGVCYRPPDQGEMRVSKNNEQEVAVCTSSSLCGILTIQTFSGRAAMCKQSKKLLHCMLATSQCKYWRGQTVLWCTWPSWSWMTAVRLWSWKDMQQSQDSGLQESRFKSVEAISLPKFQFVRQNSLWKLPWGKKMHKQNRCFIKKTYWEFRNELSSISAERWEILAEESLG